MYVGVVDGREEVLREQCLPTVTRQERFGQKQVGQRGTRGGELSFISTSSFIARVMTNWEDPQREFPEYGISETVWLEVYIQ